MQVMETDQGNETAQALRIALSRLARRLRESDAAAGAGLTPARASALLNIDRNGPLRLTELATSEGVNPTMLSRMLADLVDAGLCERSADELDRRAAWVAITPAGHELAAKLRAHRTEAVHTALARLDPADRTAIERALPALEQLAEAFT